MSIPVEIGEAMPLFVYWEDPARHDLFVIAQIYKRIPYSIIAADVSLPYVAGSPGVYRNVSHDMPNADVIDVRYDVYDSDGATLLGTSAEVFVRPAAGGGGGGGSVVFVGQPLIGSIKSLSKISGVISCD